MTQELIGKVIRVEDLVNDKVFYDYILNLDNERYHVFRLSTVRYSYMSDAIMIDNMYTLMRYPLDKPYEIMLSGRYADRLKFIDVTDEHTITFIKSAYHKYQLIEIVEK